MDKFIRAYPDAVARGDWPEIARLLSGKCRQLNRKAVASNITATTLAAENATLREERNDAFARGMAHGQKAMPKGTFNVVDSPELATLRASEAAAVERVRVLTEAVTKHLTWFERFICDRGELDSSTPRKVAENAKDAAIELRRALTPPKTEGETP